MAYLHCTKCNQDFVKLAGTTRCPECGTKSESEPWEEPLVIREENLLDQAIGQAKIVTKFGEVLQVLGYVLIGVCAIGLIFSLLSSNWVGSLFSIAVMLLIFVFYNVVGSAIRAIGLYIQIKIQ